MMIMYVKIKIFDLSYHNKKYVFIYLIYYQRLIYYSDDELAEVITKLFLVKFS